MGTHRLATWLALFSLVANAAYGLGLEHALPGDSANGDTVCAAQSVIATLSAPTQSADLSICQLQMALDRTCDGENTGSEESSAPLYGATTQNASPQDDTVALAPPHLLVGIAFALENLRAIAPAVDYYSPPGSLPMEQRQRTLRSPNAPPSIA